MTFFSEMRRIHDIQTQLRTGNIAASDRLDAATLAYLEHPTDSAARERFRQFLTLAANTGVIRAERETSPTSPQNPFHRVAHWITRSDYRRWRERCPPSLLTDTTLIDRWMPPKKPPRPPVRDIKARLQAGESIEAIRTATGASKHAIRNVKKQYGIPDATPGPKPR